MIHWCNPPLSSTRFFGSLSPALGGLCLLKLDNQLWQQRVAGVVTMRPSAAAPSSDSLWDQQASQSCPGESRGRAAKITSLFSALACKSKLTPSVVSSRATSCARLTKGTEMDCTHTVSGESGPWNTDSEIMEQFRSALDMEGASNYPSNKQMSVHRRQQHYTAVERRLTRGAARQLLYSRGSNLGGFSAAMMVSVGAGNAGWRQPPSRLAYDW